MAVSIRSAEMGELNRNCDWAFIDLGFSEKSRSCGALLNGDAPEVMQFAELQIWIRSIVQTVPGPLNLVIEAPLSVAFNSNGNPTGRAIERRGPATRYWYVGLGTTVMIAATYLLRSLLMVEANASVRLLEGLASFKERGAPSSHAGDVVALRSVAWDVEPIQGRIIPPTDLARDDSDTIRSAFEVSGMDFGIPPVVALGA